VIRSVDSTSPPEATQQVSATTVPPASAAGKSFASLHAKAVAQQDSSSSVARIVTPDGETWAPLKGDAHFARIITGPRAGQYVNLTHGERRGQVFSIERKDGKTMHVYGSGDSAKSIEAGADADVKVKGSKKVAAKAAADRPSANETWAPVDGHNAYADILQGKRNGLFVNISGGSRDGMAFQIVKHGTKTFHVYGSGKNRQVIEVGAHKKAADTSASTTTATGGTPATGGTTPTGTGGTTLAPADTAEPSGTAPASP
jgi:hypothetical protein